MNSYSRNNIFKGIVKWIVRIFKGIIKCILLQSKRIVKGIVANMKPLKRPPQNVIQHHANIYLYIYIYPDLI